MQYSLENVENILDRIKKLLVVYEYKYKDNEYTFSLANGEYLRISIPENSVAHLLGVSIDELRNFGIVKGNVDSYTALQTLLDNGAYQLFNNKELLNKVFSKDIEKKLNGFEYNAYLRTDDIHCIIKYDSEKTYQTEEHPEKCDYYIIRRNLNNYYILGLVKQGIKYRPVTSRIYDDFNEFNRFMLRIGNKQDFTYPYQYKVENPTTGFMIPSITLKLTDRKEILDKIMNISKRYSGVTSVASDYSAFINRTSNNYQRNNNEREVLRILISTIYGNDVLSNDVVQNVIGEDSVLSDDIRELIDAWNNSIVSRSNDGLASNIYSTMESNYFKEKEKNQELTQNLKEAQEKIAELEIEKQALYETNEKNSAKVKVLTDAFDMVNNM